MRQEFPRRSPPCCQPQLWAEGHGEQQEDEKLYQCPLALLAHRKMQPLTPAGKVDGEKQREFPRSGRVSRPPGVTFAVTVPALPLAPAELPSPWQMDSWF